ncbi:glycosyltransferase family 4 protein [Salinimicrobium tongyeongense]|uniref:Glycosyltransferase family 4 protein n=1 Tax=Salinimicrobium tongyeongense TaxID=2809707 RepID=A0ABY6NRH3_9FLAO|nr:glycosyltransferase family 4 protein [Salinimicrobium tongyeongense]UZH55504.1 glycosyltransferase family 4 protein [Salinimicrobium tongyeongense]
MIDTLEGYGAERSLVEIACNLQEITPVFVHLYKGNALRTVLERNGIKVYSLNISSKYAYREAVKLLNPIIQKEKPDIIHSTLFRADMIARKLKRIHPEILLVGSFVSNSYGRNRYSQLPTVAGLKLFFTQIQDRLTSGNVDYFISNSHTIKQTNSRALGIPPDKIKVIYRGRDIARSEKKKKGNLESLKVQLNLINKKVFLNVGRLQKGKGQADLLRSFKKVSDKHDDARLIIAGEGPFREELENLIGELNLGLKVQLLGYREDIAELLAISNYFVFPSYYEGLPGALIEAIIAKKPLILSDIGENRECVPGENALFFKPGNIEGLTEKINEAIQTSTWEEKTEYSLQYAHKNFNITEISKHYESFYRKIVGTANAHH